MYKVGQEVAVASFFLSLKDPGFGGFFLSWGLAGVVVVVVVAVGQVVILGSDVSFSVCKS